MTAAIDIRGQKGGSSRPRQPIEAPNDLRSVATAKILLALGEGEIAGGLDASSIFLDGTPLSEFQSVHWEFRPGSQQQSHIPGIPSVENETAVNVELRSGTPWVRTVTNPQLSAVRIRLRWPALQRQKENGDIVGYRIEYAIDIATDGGAYVEMLSTAVDGKTNSTYERSHRIDLPEGSNWQVRVRRLTPNQDSNLIADTMFVAAITEVIDRKFRYPNTALLYVEFNAEQFQSIPAVSSEPRGRLVRVPTTYDPETRTYTGTWDGTFKMAWTDNPAWITYDVIINERFGLGRRINAAQVDRWELYRIAQYCDQLVPDGRGGMEPRYICNVYIQSAAEAWQVLRDLASIYRGMIYWAHGQMITMADMPRDVDFVYTRANVVDGLFTYAGSSERVRYSRALVSFDNPENAYESDVTAVTDQRLQRRYGDNVVELAAIGCTRESEAQRRGKWALLSNSADRSVTFRVGMDGAIPVPGHVIGIADNLLAGRAIGGRIAAVDGRNITLDRDAAVKAGDRLVINLPSGKAEGRTVQSVTGRTVLVTASYSETPEPQLQYSIDADDLAIQQFRVVSVTRPEPTVYEISAIQHDPSKYAHIDTGARLVERPISVLPSTTQDAPASVTILQSISTEQTMAVTTMTIEWDAAEGAVAYEVEWRKDFAEWVRLPRTGATSVDVRGVYTGQYLARVRAINSAGVASQPRESVLTDIVGKTGAPPAVSFLTATALVFGIRLDWGFPEGAEDTLRTEIRYGPAPNEETAQHLGDYAYPTDTHTLQGLAAGINLFFQARLVDRSGNVGPWSDWVAGQSSSDATEILDYLTGKITETQLGQELLETIEDGGGAMVAIEEVINDLAAMYTIKTQLSAGGRTYLAGIGVGVENNEGIIESQVLVAADRFAVLHPNGSTVTSPFVIQGGQVFINQAFIGNASIGSAKLANWLESDALGPGGVPVLRMNFRTGEIQLNAPISGGGRMFLNNEVIKVFDGADRLRVQIGNLAI